MPHHYRPHEHQFPTDQNGKMKNALGFLANHSPLNAEEHGTGKRARQWAVRRFSEEEFVTQMAGKISQDIVLDLILEIKFGHHLFSLSLNVCQGFVPCESEIRIQIRQRVLKHLLHAGLATSHEPV